MRKSEKLALQIAALPADLYEAVKEMEKDALVCQVLGSHISERYAKAKKAGSGQRSSMRVDAPRLAGIRIKGLRLVADQAIYIGAS